MVEKDNIPKHVAIIMDGNGRWAKAKGLPRVKGHQEGIKRVKEILRVAADCGVKFLTLYAFSAENWSRPKAEIEVLMRSLDNFLSNNINELNENGVRLIVIGRKDPIPAYLWKRLEESQRQTKDNTGLTVCLAFNYGSRQEIADAAKKAARELSEGRIKAEDFDEKIFAAFLYTQGMPDPDLLIRTSGEIRLSNFLLWQASYAEFYFTETLWPDFKENDFMAAISEYQNRKRRFGGI